jgi:uncharacterized repeat protein (TIGR01451 family)
MRLTNLRLLIRLKYKTFALILFIPCVVLTTILATQAEGETSKLTVQNGPQNAGNAALAAAQINQVIVSRQTPNLVPDPSFEEASQLPNTLWPSTGNCTFALDTTTAYEGDQSARIVGDSTTCDLRTKLGTIPVEIDHVYDFSCWVKSDLLAGDAYLLLRFVGNGQNTVAEAETQHIIQTNNAWVELTGSIRAPDKATGAQLQLKISHASAGSVWFDHCFVGLAVNLEIEKIDQPTQVEPGESLTYIITYRNVGRETATNVQIFETYDREVIFQTADPAPDFSNNIWRIGSLPPNTTGHLTIIAQVKSEVNSNVVVNLVEMTSDETTVTFQDITTTSITDTSGISTCRVQITPSTLAQGGLPGAEILYPYLITNKGKGTGIVTLEASSSHNWQTNLSPTVPFSLPPGASQPITASLRIPLTVTTALSGTVDLTTITATQTCDDKITTGLATATTTITQKISLILSPNRTQYPENPIPFSHWLTNTGNWTDTIELSAVTEPATLTTIFEPAASLSLGVGASAPITMTVFGVATDVLHGPLTKAVITVTAQSQSGPAGVGEAIDRAETTCRVNIAPPSQAITGKVGDEVVHTYTISNTGLQTGTVTVETNNSQNWDGHTIPSAAFSLPPGASQPLTTSLAIPVDVTEAISGTINLATITPTLQCDQEIIHDQATALTMVERTMGVDIEPNRTIPPRNPVIFSHLLTNTGNWTDTIYLIVTPNPPTLAITVEPSAILAVGPGIITPITVTASGIPTELSGGSPIRALISVTAQLASDPVQADEVVDIVKIPVIYLPIVYKNYFNCVPDPTDEPDNDGSNNIADALEVCPGQAVAGRVSKQDDRDDVYKILAQAGQQLTISLSGPSSSDADLFLYPPGTIDLATNPPFVASSRGNTSDEFIQYTVESTDFWYIRVFAFSGVIEYNLTVTVSGP